MSEDTTVALSKEDYDVLLEKASKVDKGEEDKKALVAEITDLREKRRIAESHVEELNKKLKPIPPSDDVEQVVERILSKKTKEDSVKNKENAFKLFKETHKEFHADNDPAGLKMAAMEKAFSEFNLDGVHSVEDYMSKLEKARRLVVDVKSPAPVARQVHGEPAEDLNPIPEFKDDNLTSVELKIIDRTFNGDKKRYLAIKAKDPKYVNNLLKYAN